MATHHFTFQVTDENDAGGIREVETRASSFSKEAGLTASLLEGKSTRLALSLLARHEGKAVGHILFTRVAFRGEMDSPLMHILAPPIVMPEYQGMSVGERLIRAGIEHLRLMGCQTVFVLGHTILYPRYGFEPCAGDKDYPAPYPIPEKHKTCWMMQALTVQPMNVTGRI